jgi:hypothetical protein
VQGVTLIGPITTTTKNYWNKRRVLPFHVGWVFQNCKIFDSCEIIIMLLTQTLFPPRRMPPKKTHCKARLTQKKSDNSFVQENSDTNENNTQENAR